MKQQSIINQIKRWVKQIGLWLDEVWVEATAVFQWTWQLFYQLGFELCGRWSNVYLTETSCIFIAGLTAWICTLLLFTFLFAVLANATSAILKFIAEKTTETVKKGIIEVITGISKTCWYIITFIPKTLWKTIFKSSS